ncbi:MAG: LysM peptidoglycan-binding domain-containing protein [Mariniblastus sp.]|nr:LysM peptidoglycan-binding domain-containing protein [Mariniblastus sp.]
MDSLKNTMVAVMLLVVTYGVYQVVNTPDPDSREAAQMEAAGEPSLTIERESIPKTVLDSDSLTTDMPDSPRRHLQDDLAPAPLPEVQDQPKLLPRKEELAELEESLEMPVGSAEVDDLVYIQPKPLSPPQPAVEPEIATVAGASNYDPTKLQAAWPLVEQLVGEGNYRLALRQLSGFYPNASSMDEADQQKLYEWLDSLAAKVIYSTEHHLRTLPYIVQPNDSLENLAERWQVPADLIYFVNRAKIPDRNALQPGNELKMISGPFDAEIDRSTGTMTLFWKQLYAGRFTVQIDSPGSLNPGEYGVVSKSVNAVSHGPYHIGLDNGMSLHALAPGSASSIGLSEQQAQEVFAILSESSKVRIAQ